MNSDFQKTYAAYNLNDPLRANSTSGGMYILAADYVIKNNGIVFGVDYDENYNPCHKYADTLDDSKRFCKSKYAQSRIGNSFIDAKFFLDQGKTVLFTGTPCQIAGLKSFLAKDYSNLITIDCVCHGVPSPMIWQKYISEKVASTSNLQVDFRDKSTGWDSYSITIKNDIFSYSKKFFEDAYMCAFIKNYSLRPSCYNCRFKGNNIESDLTLGDLWGAKEITPKFYDNKGLSLIFVNTQNGKKIWDICKKHMEYCEIDKNIAISHNPSIIFSSTKPRKRKKFINMIVCGNSVEYSLFKCSKKSVFGHLKKLIKSLKRMVFK